MDINWVVQSIPRAAAVAVTTEATSVRLRSSVPVAEIDSADKTVEIISCHFTTPGEIIISLESVLDDKKETTVT